MLSDETNKDPECLWDDSETWIKYYSWETPFHQKEIPLSSDLEGSGVAREFKSLQLPLQYVSGKS